ncbi:ExeM/NucH family extracellular endonuclease [Marinobacterium rhizophilum]|uniref:ExeM/NucH family extracellular endonuclease n=1 Tax=Marinobacterium rhizophilum TaxID=420402 RepID=UPI00037C996E|nr:ExeM/NucH family extracellular endonuclease [Marinobacterium rhizophilum]
MITRAVGRLVGGGTLAALLTVTATASQAAEPTGLACGDPATLIHQIQGSGTVFDSDYGGVQSVEAVVTAVMPGLNGFYVQEEAPDADGDAATSEGLFVFVGNASLPGISIGDLVRVTGTVRESVTAGGASSQTEISQSPVTTVCSTASQITPTDIELPLADSADLEAVEGMLVRLPQALTISEYFNFDRFGEVVLSLPKEGDDRLYTPTSVVPPGAEANALAQDNALRSILIDDGRSISNPDPAIHPGNGESFDLGNRFRGADRISAIQGVIDDSFGSYRLQPSLYGSYEAVNSRPETPNDVGGNVHVASLNVLNYFLTLRTGGSCGPAGDLNCRGASTAAELERQRTKLLATLEGLDADVVGLVELENSIAVEPAADLVAGLNALDGAGSWAYVDTGVIGNDAVRVGLIYRPAIVQPVGGFAILDASVDPRFLDNKNRPALAQTFATVASGERFTLVVNHFKSKGSSCDDVGDSDAGDGQGNCNQTRTKAAAALADWLASDPTGHGEGRTLIIGDLNAYDQEDPVALLKEQGYIDLIAAFNGEKAYSYLFDGQLGYLDHALASPALAGAVTGATVWHINADEPDILDYRTTFKKLPQQALFEDNAFRSSDHDPVIVGLDLTPPQLEVSVTPDLLWPPKHRYVEVVATVTATDETDATPLIKLLSVVSTEPDNGDDDGNTTDDVRIIDDYHFELRAERSGSGLGRAYIITYSAENAAGTSTEASATVWVPLQR